jgi:hypothetical protein
MNFSKHEYTYGYMFTFNYTLKTHVLLYTGDVSALSNMETFDNAVAGVRELQLKLTDLPLGMYIYVDRYMFI